MHSPPACWAAATHCAGGASPAVCGGGAGGAFWAAPGPQTGSRDIGEAALGEASVGPGELAACLRFGRAGASAGARALAAAATLGGSVFGSGFMMLIGGIDAALGKSASITIFFCPARPGAVEGPPTAAAASATGTSACCAQALA
jgi:hypothetical protein